MLIIIGIIIVIGGFVVINYNNLVRSREMVKNAMAQIAANVESRWDAISNMIGATQQYSEREAETLREITQARAGITPSSTTKNVEADEELFQNVLRSINVVAENYPELKASELYKTTMNNVDKYETNVRMSRQIYNDTVTKFNRKIKVFPTNLIAGIFGFVEEDYFTTTEGKSNMPQWS